MAGEVDQAARAGLVVALAQVVVGAAARTRRCTCYRLPGCSSTSHCAARTRQRITHTACQLPMCRACQLLSLCTVRFALCAVCAVCAVNMRVLPRVTPVVAISSDGVGGGGKKEQRDSAKAHSLAGRREMYRRGRRDSAAPVERCCATEKKFCPEFCTSQLCCCGTVAVELQRAESMKRLNPEAYYALYN